MVVVVGGSVVIVAVVVVVVVVVVVGVDEIVVVGDIVVVLPVVFVLNVLVDLVVDLSAIISTISAISCHFDQAFGLCFFILAKFCYGFVNLYRIMIILMKNCILHTSLLLLRILDDSL